MSHSRPCEPPWPEFGAGVTHREQPCSPNELFTGLFTALEEHVHLLEPAFAFVRAALERAAARNESPVQLIEWSRRELAFNPRDFDTRWPVRVVRELAPLGLSDGAWLRGSSLANAVETETSMALLRQLMLRFGDPQSREAYGQRYAALLRSLGLPPTALASADAAPSPLSYEHALLGLGLGFFPTTFAAETLGFNLWLAAVGPCPLLEALAPALREQGACLRYLELYERAELERLALSAIELARHEHGDSIDERVARGFVAAHESYARWARALLEIATSPDAPLERALAGYYAPPQEPESLAEFALERYGALSHTELYYCCANSDLHPAIHVFGRFFVGEVFSQLEEAMASDARLNSQHPPPYSERTVAEIVAAQHEKNVRSRPDEPVRPARDAVNEDVPSIIQVFDGSWLQGFADVERADFEEYGWLFRIYASEHGDGDWDYNHCQIFRRAFAQLGPDVMLPKTDRRLYDLFEIGVAAVATLAVALNTRRFMPEILGINLGIEATGVGGSYMDQWKGARGPGARWRALAWRLHNSIDNYADGHTKWSLSAVQSFMRRVKDATPSAVEHEWQKIWRLWRCQDILTHGTDSEQAALAEHLSLESLAPTPA
jgi:heme oxygenase-like protein